MSSAAGHIITLLALYFAAIILAVQHASDRYSPALGVPVLLRYASLPFAALIILATLAALLSIEGRAAGAMLLGALLASLYGSYRLWSRLGDGERIAGLLRTIPAHKREDAVREVLWNAAQRANPRVTAVALCVFPTGTPEQDRLLRWLADHREVLAKEWMTRELVAVLLPLDAAGPFGEEDSRTLETLLVDALDREDYDRALLTLDAVMNALARANPWTQVHADLLHAFGFALWNVGRSSESMPRTAHVPARLESIQSLIHPRLRRLWGHLLEFRDPEAVEAYAQALGYLAAETGDGFLLTRLYEAMEGGFRRGLWTEQALHQLASDLGAARRGRGAESGDPAFEPERIDALAVTGAAMLVETDREAGLDHYLGNSMLFKDSLRHVREQEWLRPESYATVQRALSRR